MVMPPSTNGATTSGPAPLVRLLGSAGVARDLAALVLDPETSPVDDTRPAPTGEAVVVVLVDPAPVDWDEAEASGCPMILFSERYLEDEEVTETVLRGAEAVIHAGSRPEELLDAVQVVAAGGTLLDPGQVRALAIAARARDARPNPIMITKREQQILLSITAGHAVKQTAVALGISAKTVESLQGRLFCKLGVRNRAQAVARAHELGLLAQTGGDRHAT